MKEDKILKKIEKIEDDLNEIKEKLQEKKADVKSIDLVMILDESGSMFDLTKDTVGGFNAMIEKQKKEGIPVKVTTVMFNGHRKVVYERKDINEVNNLTENDYIPSGSTALLDAVGDTLTKMNSIDEVKDETNRVLTVIITDGEENSSREWSKARVKKLISSLQEKNFEFIFLGADIDAVSAASSIGIRPMNSIKYQKTGYATTMNFMAVNDAVKTVASNVNLSTTAGASWKNTVVEDKGNND